MLMAQHLIGFGVGGGKEFAFLGTAEDEGSAGSYSMASQPFGSVSSTRRIAILGVVQNDDSNGDTIDSITIGGVAADIILQNSDTNGTNSSTSFIAIANVPTGVVGTISFSTSSILAGTGYIGIYRLDGFDSYAATNTASNDDNPISMTIDVPGSGLLLAVAAMVSLGAVTTVGVTEDFELGPVPTAIGGSAYNLPAEVGRTVSFTGGVGYAAGVAASFS
jgi:hypothetical protein